MIFTENPEVTVKFSILKMLFALVNQNKEDWKIYLPLRRVCSWQQCIPVVRYFCVESWHDDTYHTRTPGSHIQLDGSAC